MGLTPEFSSSSIKSSFVFALTCLGYTASLRQKVWFTTTKGKHGEDEYDKTLNLRNKHFSSSLSVSYSNSGPLMILKGSGSRLVDHRGISYLDTRNNVAHVGHCNQRVVNAVQQQVSLVNTNSRYLHPNLCILASRLSSLLPDPLEVVFFVNSGSEANDLALRLARAHTQSCHTIVLDHAYHGHTLANLAVSPYKYTKTREHSAIKHEQADKIHKVPAPDMYRLPPELEGKHELDIPLSYASHVKKVIENIQHQNSFPCAPTLIMESGMSVAGVILPPPLYFETVATHVHDAGGLWIADEVQTGFGRLGHDSMWAFPCNIVPDIVTVGKPFGNGMPLAAVITSKNIANSFDSMGVEYFNTFGGNPVCAAAGLAMLDELESRKLPLHASRVGRYLKQSLEKLRDQEGCDLIGEVRGQGLFLGIDLVRCPISKEPATAEASFLCTILKSKYHILTSLDGPYNNVFVIKPPMVFSIQDADFFISSLTKAIKVDLKEYFERADNETLPISHTPT